MLRLGCLLAAEESGLAKRGRRGFRVGRQVPIRPQPVSMKDHTLISQRAQV